MNWAYIIFSYLSLFALSFLDNGRGPAYPDILSHFSISTQEGAYFFSLSSFTSIGVNLLAKHWLKWLGVVNSNRLGLLFLAGSGFIISLAAKNVSFSLLMLGAFVLGLGLSSLAITMNILVAQGSNSKNKRALFSGLHATYGVGSFLAPFLFNYLLSKNYIWSDYFFLVMIIPLVVFMSSLFMKENKKNEEKKNLHIPISFFKRVPFGLIFGMYVGSELVVSSRLVLYLQTAKGFSASLAGIYLSMFFAFLLAGRLLFALKHFPLSNRTLMFLSLITTMISFIAGIYIHPFFLSFLGLCMSYFFPISMDWLSDMFQEGVEFMTASVMTYIGIALGSMHFLFGFISDRYGIETAFLMIPALQSICLILLYFNKGSEVKEA
jgi:fucose permease